MINCQKEKLWCLHLAGKQLTASGTYWVKEQIVEYLGSTILFIRYFKVITPFPNVIDKTKLKRWRWQFSSRIFIAFRMKETELWLERTTYPKKQFDNLSAFVIVYKGFIIAANLLSCLRIAFNVAKLWLIKILLLIVFITFYSQI